MDDIAARTAPPDATPIDLTFENRGHYLVGLSVVNALLILATLGIYASWAKAEVRRRIWSFIRLNREPLEYTGTGLELFLGLLIATLFVILPAVLGAVAVTLFFPGNAFAMPIYQAVLYALFFLLIGNAIYRAWRYRLSRTRWRAIRGAITGSPAAYGWAYFWTLAAPIALVALLAGTTAYTLGPQFGASIALLGVVASLWVLPWRANKLRRMMTNDTSFGDRQLSYDGRAGPLYRAFFTAWFGGALVLVGAIAATAWIAVGSGLGLTPDAPAQLLAPGTVAAMISVWILALVLAAILTTSYRARQIRHFAAHTHFEDATFGSSVTGRGLLWITLSNWALKFAAIILALIVSIAVLFASGMAPTRTQIPLTDAEPSFSALDILQAAIVIAVVVLFSTIAGTIAQVRSARYLISNTKLDGALDLARIAQSASKAPARGEGLAQVFDVDAF